MPRQKSSPSPVGRWLEHITVLAGDIGPRGSTTEGERRGHDYCMQVLEGLGLDPSMEHFQSASSIYKPQLLTGILIILSFAIYPLGGQLTAAIAAGLSLFAVICQTMELSFMDNPYRWVLPKGRSQNVIAITPPSGQHRQDLILIGHVDTHRTPIIFSSYLWIDIFRVFVMVAYVSFIVQVALFTLGATTGFGWVWAASSVAAICGVLLVVLCIHGEFTPFSPGANDNATAIGLILTLANVFKTTPLHHTRVWLVCSGCEEVKHYGAIDFFKRHKAEMVNPHTLDFEMLGLDGPAFLLQEGMVGLFNYRSDPMMVNLAEQIANEHPEWEAHPTRVAVGYTEMADAVREGIPAISFIGIGKDGIPMGYRGTQYYWHRMDDTPDKIRPDVLARAYAFTLAFIQRLDSLAAKRATGR